MIFLDPHTTQSSGSVNNKSNDQERKIDNSYHCQFASRLHILQMDPSVAVVMALINFYHSIHFCYCILVTHLFFVQCFLCRNEEEFNSLCSLLKDNLLSTGKQPLFEICEERTDHWRTVHPRELKAESSNSKSLPFNGE